MKCQICRKHEATVKDYRFIDSCGLQGKVLDCEWCFELNDETIRKVVRLELDPESFYSKPVGDNLTFKDETYAEEGDNNERT